MEVILDKIEIPLECDTCSAKLHFLEHPKLRKKVRGYGIYEFMSYQDILGFQRDIIRGYKDNPVLNEVLTGGSIEKILMEMEVVDSIPGRWLPRMKDEEWNKRVRDLTKLIGTDYTDVPIYEKKERDFYSPRELMKKNFLPNTLDKKGFLNPGNPVSCACYIASFNASTGLVVDIYNGTFPFFTLLGVLCGGGFGAGLGAVSQEMMRKKLPYDEALYLDRKIDELGLREKRIEEYQPYKMILDPIKVYELSNPNRGISGVYCSMTDERNWSR